MFHTHIATHKPYLIKTMLKHQEQQNSQNHPLFPSSQPAKLNVDSLQKKRLHITIDFEEMFDWSDHTHNTVSVRNINEIETFHNICLNNGIQLTYLVTHKVLQSKSAIDFLKNIYSGHYEIGIHLHSWNSPPIKEIDKHNTFQCNLPSHVEHLKISNLIQLFEEKLNFKPLIHRAGRYGGTEQTLKILKAQGIKIDLSPSAGYNFTYLNGPNFKTLKNKPFWSDNDKKTLCLPLPSLRFIRGPDKLNIIMHKTLTNHPRLQNLLYRIIPSTPIRLTPESHTIERMKILGTAIDKQGVNDVILSIHSTSLYLGGNTYSSSLKDVKNNINNLIEYFLWSSEYLHTRPSTPINALDKYK